MDIQQTPKPFTPPDGTPQGAAQTLFVVLRPDGQPSLRTLHTKPTMTISKLEEDHTEDWVDLYARGYRLATVTLLVQHVHADLYSAIYHYENKPQP